jgi:hypothetical protein
MFHKRHEQSCEELNKIFEFVGLNLRSKTSFLWPYKILIVFKFNISIINISLNVPDNAQIIVSSFWEFSNSKIFNANVFILSSFFTL